MAGHTLITSLVAILSASIKQGVKKMPTALPGIARINSHGATLALLLGAAEASLQLAPLQRNV